MHCMQIHVHHADIQTHRNASKHMRTIPPLTCTYTSAVSIIVCVCVCVCLSGPVSPQLAIVLRIPLVLVSAHCLNIEYTDYCWLLLVVCVCECVFICLVVTADTSYVIGLWSGKQDTADQVQ